MSHLIKTFVCYCCLLLSACNCDPKRGISFKARIVNLGSVQVNNTYDYQFVVWSEGSTPFKITNVVGDCGCLNLKWTTKEITGGLTDTIRGSITVADTGYFEKTIMLHSTSTDSMFYALRVVGNGR